MIGLQRIATIPARSPKREPTRNTPPPIRAIAEKPIITAPHTEFSPTLDPSIRAPTRTINPEMIPTRGRFG